MSKPGVLLIIASGSIVCILICWGPNMLYEHDQKIFDYSFLQFTNCLKIQLYEVLSIFLIIRTI